MKIQKYNQLPPKFKSWTELYINSKECSLLENKEIFIKDNNVEYRIEISFLLKETLEDVFSILKSEENIINIFQALWEPYNEESRYIVSQFLKRLLSLWPISEKDCSLLIWDITKIGREVVEKAF